MLQDISRDPIGGFWTAEVNAYRVSKWASADERPQTFERIASWFPVSANGSVGGPNAAPSPQLASIQADSSGFLWTYIRMPKSTWRNAWPTPVFGLSEIAINAEMINKLYTTVVEVLDPKSRSVKIRYPLDGVIVSALPGNRVAMYSVDRNGFPKLRVLQLKMVPSPAQGAAQNIKPTRIR
jgi:hypothetical protein